MIVIMFALAGMVLLGAGVMWWQNTRNFVQSAEHADGTVIEIVRSRDRDGNTMFSPVVEFTDHQGQRREYHSNTKSNPSFYSVGDKVQILYDRDRPDSAGINHWLDLYLGPLVLIVIGAGFLFVVTVLSVVFLLFFRSPKNPTNDTGEENAEEEPAAVSE